MIVLYHLWKWFVRFFGGFGWWGEEHGRFRDLLVLLLLTLRYRVSGVRYPGHMDRNRKPPRLAQE